MYKHIDIYIYKYVCMFSLLLYIMYDIIVDEYICEVPRQGRCHVQVHVNTYRRMCWNGLSAFGKTDQIDPSLGIYACLALIYGVKGEGRCRLHGCAAFGRLILYVFQGTPCSSYSHLWSQGRHGSPNKCIIMDW